MRRQLKDQSRKTLNVSSFLGQNIRKYRLGQNFSQAKIAEILRVTPQAVSKWERGITLPDIELLIPLADIFSVTVDELLGRYGNV